MGQETEWSGSPAPEAPDTWWIDDATGEYVSAITGERMSPAHGRAAIANLGRTATTCLETAYGSTQRLSFQIKVF